MFGYAYDEFDYIPIVNGKYKFLHLNSLRNICNKMTIPFGLNDTKNNLVYIKIPQALDNKNFLRQFYNRLNEKEQNIFQYILYYEYNDLKVDVKQKFKFNIELNNKKKIIQYVWWLELFIYNGIFDEYFKNIFIQFIPDPNPKRLRVKLLQSVEDISKIKIEKFTKNREKISQNLSVEKYTDFIFATRLIYELANSNKIQIIQNGSLAKRTKKILDEVFDFNYIKLLILLSNFNYLSNNKYMLPTSRFKKIINLDDGEYLKSIVNRFITFDIPYEYKYLDISTSPHKDKFIIKFRKDILNIIRKQDVNRWINIDYIVSQIKLDKTTLKNVTNGYRYAYNANGVYNSILYLESMVRYMIKSFIRFMYELNVCEIAVTPKKSYTIKDLSLITFKYEDIISKIEYFKLTSIGKFTFDIEKKFKSSNDYQLILNQYTLDIVVENYSAISDMFLKNIAIKIDEKKYKTNISVFMKNINTKQEYETIKNNFLNRCETIPQNWRSFFETIDQRVEFALIVNSSVILVKLKQDKDILKIISSNTKLQNKIIKADNLHMVILQQDLVYVKKVFKEYGIIL